MIAGDEFQYQDNKYLIESFDCREDRAAVARDNGVDAEGNERWIDARRTVDGARRMFSSAEAGLQGWPSYRGLDVPVTREDGSKTATAFTSRTFTFRFEYSVEADNVEEAVKEVAKALEDGYSFRTSVADVLNEAGVYMTTVDFEHVAL